MNPLYPKIAARAGYRCEFCHAPQVVSNLPFEVDHVIPSSKQGKDHESNLALACRACNLFKLNYLAEIDPETNRITTLFHPRNDEWESHFVVDLVSGEILGSTPTGRATVLRLRMNTDWQFTARQSWIRLGLFP